MKQGIRGISLNKLANRLVGNVIIQRAYLIWTTRCYLVGDFPCFLMCFDDTLHTGTHIPHVSHSTSQLITCTLIFLFTINHRLITYPTKHAVHPFGGVSTRKIVDVKLCME